MSSLEDLLNKSIPELSDLFVRRRRPVPKGLLEALEVDKRQGAHQLAKRILAALPGVGLQQFNIGKLFHVFT